MARTEKRGARGRADRRATGEKPVGPGRDPEDDIYDADQRGSIKPHRPDKEWLRKNISEE